MNWRGVVNAGVGDTPIRYAVEQVPDDGDGQVAATIARMSEYVCFDCQAGPVIYDAQTAIASDPSDPLSCIHSFVRSRMRFVSDETIAAPYAGLLPGCAPSVGDAGTGGATGGTGQQPDTSENYFVEVLVRPVDVSLQYAATGQQVEEDCDGFASYTAALLKALGIDCAFVTVAADPANPQVFSHVYVAAYYRGKRVAMDCSHGKYAGWETPNPYRLQEWPIVDRTSLGLVGLAFVAAGWFAWVHRQTIRELLS